MKLSRELPHGCCFPAADDFVGCSNAAIQQDLDWRGTAVFAKQALQGANIDAGGIGDV